MTDRVYTPEELDAMVKTLRGLARDGEANLRAESCQRPYCKVCTHKRAVVKTLHEAAAFIERMGVVH